MARLARLDIDDASIPKMADELARIVGTVASLADVASEPAWEQLESHRHTASAMPLREDEPVPSLPNTVVLGQAPLALDGGFAVPTFVDEG